MTSSFFDMVCQFHRAAGFPVRSEVQWFASDEEEILRRKLIREEFAELEESWVLGDIVGMVDGICDLIWVLCGAAAELGVPLNEAYADVHRSNMTKTIEPTYREDGKLMKGKFYDPPRLEPIIYRETEVTLG